MPRNCQDCLRVYQERMNNIVPPFFPFISTPSPPPPPQKTKGHFVAYAQQHFPELFFHLPNFVFLTVVAVLGP